MTESITIPGTARACRFDYNVMVRADLNKKHMACGFNQLALAPNAELIRVYPRFLHQHPQRSDVGHALSLPDTKTSQRSKRQPTLNVYRRQRAKLHVWSPALVRNTVIHRNITCIKHHLANYLLSGYNYNYMNNCQEKIFLACASASDCTKHQLQIHT